MFNVAAIFNYGNDLTGRASGWGKVPLDFSPQISTCTTLHHHQDDTDDTNITPPARFSLSIC